MVNGLVVFLVRESGAKCMKVKELLPIGSIVLLKDAQRNIMICGLKQIKVTGDASENFEEELYDYAGVMYPEGFISNKLQFLFNHEDIETIVFIGYENEERIEFTKKLAAHYKEV